MPIDTIAVATDFSSRADRAIDRARQLRQSTGANLRFIHATSLAEDDPADIAALTQRMRLTTGLDDKEDGVEFVFPAGSPPAAIANACERDDISMLVIGPARYNTLGDFFLGTAVDYVLRNMAKPVLVAKMRANGPYRQIVAGTDFSVGSAHAILTAARMFPEAAIHVVHAWHVPFQAWQKDSYVAEEVEKAELQNMKQFLARLKEHEARLGDATYELVMSNASEAIRRGLELDPSALVVLGSHGASGFRQAAIGSVTSDLLRAIEADTLVVNTKDAEV
ncbi:universal stress protein [Erythrobacter rubeus]|uniref:Universal stress protein n=1 Tax=Erythrobacter rubeus TaxID=2760803 RepID=A0ABR8KSP5_9SPHN|nr:universal stress protein [Erythrobacter rubeus]MBD2842103.1 universal stress protein [Erythrobacter rubeus]